MFDIVNLSAQQCAEAIANSLDVEVTIIDGSLTRIAGTGRYRSKVGEKIPEYLALANVIKTGNSHIVDNPRDNAVCKTCKEKDTCDEKGYMNIPISDGKVNYGAISILCTNEKQLEILLNKKESLYRFLGNIGELLVSKYKEAEYISRLELNNSQFNTIFSSISEGILLTDENGMVINCSNAVNKLINISKERLLGQNINEIFAGIDIDRIKKNEEDAQFREIELKKNKKVFLCLSNTIVINKLVKGSVIVLIEDSKINSIIYRKIHDQKIFTFDDMIGASEAFTNAVKMGKKVAAFDSNILILGESGTGKELFARSIHNHNRLDSTPFIAINCAAIPESLLESELFGYEEGAFTGAKQTGKPGKFELANGGTIFLDEIGDMPLHLQVKILRVLQERTIERIGGVRPIPVKVRVIAATNKNLEKMVENKEFREDLYYRINVFQIKLPSLRERRVDIPLLVDYFVEKYCSKFGVKKKLVEDNALSMLSNYNWKGNIRELQNIIEYLCCVSSSEVITLEDAKSRIHSSEQENIHLSNSEVSIVPICYLEKREIEKALVRYGRTTDGKLKAAKVLGIGKSTLYRKLKEYNIEA